MGLKCDSVEAWDALQKLERPRFAVYDHEATVEGAHYRPGTWYHGIKQSGRDGTLTLFDHWICSPLHMVAETVNEEDGKRGRLLCFSHRERAVEWVMPMAMLTNRSGNVLKALLRQGLSVEYLHRRQVVAYLRSLPRPDRTVVTPQGS